MNKLSAEIISIIISHLFPKTPVRRPISDQSRGPYTITRNWQYAMEAQTFANIRLRSNEFTTFAETFSDPRRQSLLRRLEFVICLPTHGDSREDHAVNEAAFGDALEKLLNLLKTWESNVASIESLPDLELRLSCVWDISGNSDGPVDRNFNVSNSAAARRYLELGVHRATTLPIVRRITAYKTDVSLGLAFHPTSMCQIAGVFPRLTSLDLEYRDPAVKRREMRQDHRTALAKGLDDLRERLPVLSKLHIRRQGGWDPVNHSFTCQDFSDIDGVDVLCEAIRRLAQTEHLTRLDLTNILISADLFHNRRSNGADVAWPTLRQLQIQDGIVSSNGKWYYTGDPDEVEAGETDPEDLADDVDSDTDSAASDESEDHSERDAIANGSRPAHQWRLNPDPETFDPLVKTMADTILHRMPALEYAGLDIGSELEEAVGITVQCVNRGIGFFQAPDRVRDTAEDKAVRRFKTWVGITTQWELPRDIRSLWEQWVGEGGQVIDGKWPPISGYTAKVTVV